MPDRAHFRRRGLSAVLAIALFTVAACNSEPTPAATPTPLPITPTIFASPTPQPTATPTPAPTPTPSAAELDSQALRTAFNGDYATAISLEQQALAMFPPESEQAAQARINIGQWHIANNNAAAAIDALATVINLQSPPQGRDAISNLLSLQTEAHILTGRATQIAGNALGATANFSTAIDAGSVLTPWLHLWIGDALLNSQQITNALPYLQASLDGAPNVSQEFSRREKIALAHQLLGNFPAALEQYDVILSRAQNAGYRARILWESAQALLAAGQTATAYQRMSEIVTLFPKSPQAAQAVTALVNAGQQVDELQRGIIGYNNGLYEAARDAFRRAITLYPDRANDVRYWAGLNYLRLGSPADALRNWDQTIAANPPGTPAVAQALAEKAKYFANAGDAENAKLTFTQLISNAPASNAGGEAMFSVAQQFARNGALVSEAAQAYLAADALQFNEERGAEALARAAGLLYRLGQITDVLTTSQTLIEKFPARPQALLGQLWQGKAQIAAGNAPSGTATLRDLIAKSPDSYEGTRAAELLSDPNRAPLSLPSPTNGGGVGGGDDAEQQQAEDWLRNTLNLSSTVKVRDVRDDIRNDPRFIRGNALWRLGFKAEAVDEYESLRLALASDALAQYQLALYFRDIGLYRQSIAAADTLMRITPAKTPSNLPAFIAKLIYPTYYADLVLQHSNEHGLDPLLVFSLIRQESLFEPFAESFAAANGLMQVIPTTGQEIYNELNWPPNYTTADLQKPYVSVRFGTHYLNKQRRFFNGDLYAALAAYNGGAGNSMIWRERSGGDPDVFFSSINFEETQRYIRTIGANYSIYHRLYGDK
jgi:soluble lytic murein transglycosylase